MFCSEMSPRGIITNCRNSILRTVIVNVCVRFFIADLLKAKSARLSQYQIHRAQGVPSNDSGVNIEAGESFLKFVILHSLWSMTLQYMSPKIFFFTYC